jgi:hypothetical protein
MFQNHALNVRGPTDLPLLARVNFINGMSINALTLGIDFGALHRRDYLSPFNQHGPDPASKSSTSVTAPEALQPTALQRIMPHRPWIDLFPVAAMRENILRGIASGLFREDDICYDLMGLEDGHESLAPLVIWGTSWDIRDWEMSPTFLRKWACVVQGCPEVLESTNEWRMRRGASRMM